MSTKAEVPETIKRPRPVVEDNGPLGYLMDSDRFGHIWRVGEAFAASSLVPQRFQGQRNDCFIGCLLAIRLNIEPFMLFQHLYVVHGRPGMEAKLVIGLLNASGKIRGPLRYRFDGDGDEYGCRAVCTDAFTGDELEGPKVDWKMVKGEGWNKPMETRGGGRMESKWTTMPEQMFRYRAAAFLVRAHYPEVMLGLHTREELEETVIDVEHQLAQPAEPQTAAPRTKTEAIEQSLSTQAAQTPEPTDAPPVPEPVSKPPLAEPEKTEAAEPPPPETEPKAPAAEAPPEPQSNDKIIMEHFKTFCGELAEADTIKAVAVLFAQYTELLPQECHPEMLTRRRDREAEIRQKRAGKSDTPLLD